MVHSLFKLDLLKAQASVSPASDDNIFLPCVASNNISASSELSHNTNEDENRHNS
jgi:hypothetical protein